jgi:hypothetical protein
MLNWIQSKTVSQYYDKCKNLDFRDSRQLSSWNCWWFPKTKNQTRFQAVHCLCLLHHLRIRGTQNTTEQYWDYAILHKRWILKQNFTFSGRQQPDGAKQQNVTPTELRFVYIAAYLLIDSRIFREFLMVAISRWSELPIFAWSFYANSYSSFYRALGASWETSIRLLLPSVIGRLLLSLDCLWFPQKYQ